MTRRRWGEPIRRKARDLRPCCHPDRAPCSGGRCEDPYSTEWDRRWGDLRDGRRNAFIVEETRETCRAVHFGGAR